MDDHISQIVISISMAYAAALPCPMTNHKYAQEQSLSLQQSLPLAISSCSLGLTRNIQLLVPLAKKDFAEAVSRFGLL